jgi:hypothetical protein
MYSRAASTACNSSGPPVFSLTRFDREDCGGLARVRQHMIGGTGQSRRAADASHSPKLAKYTKIE